MSTNTTKYNYLGKIAPEFSVMENIERLVSIGEIPENINNGLFFCKYNNSDIEIQTKFHRAMFFIKPNYESVEENNNYDDAHIKLNTLYKKLLESENLIGGSSSYGDYILEKYKDGIILIAEVYDRVRNTEPTIHLKFPDIKATEKIDVHVDRIIGVGF